MNKVKFTLFICLFLILTSCGMSKSTDESKTVSEHVNNVSEQDIFVKDVQDGLFAFGTVDVNLFISFIKNEGNQKAYNYGLAKYDNLLYKDMNANKPFLAAIKSKKKIPYVKNQDVAINTKIHPNNPSYYSEVNNSDALLHIYFRILDDEQVAKSLEDNVQNLKWNKVDGYASGIDITRSEYESKTHKKYGEILYSDYIASKYQNPKDTIYSHCVFKYEGYLVIVFVKSENMKTVLKWDDKYLDYFELEIVEIK